ncbi:DUF1501 domain-containing protein [Polyangium mundeleinium]|uniref:DUF1501 domain-containing protein n=1 Tax=Polyangium mundeleinium TaxID=2995306 RepID=A0ABT5ESR5_9BACT|nr:DUF1501 domain-containing protein [Polyangium mundeleinium]MDC0744243.1 DUF1501 domain-containing protein [Polyangium mundeleinium]
MKTSRRNLLLAALGASQLALLGRFAVRSASAAPPPSGPTKLLCIWLDGGCNWEHFFTPLTGAGIDKFIQPPDGGVHPFGYSKEQVRNFDGTAADLGSTNPTRKLRGPVSWNDANPADTTGSNPLSGGTQNYRPWGYSWVDPKYKLYERTCVLVGADQGTASHGSGIIASMCGVAGSSFRAPSVQAVIANHMAAYFPDRPVPNATLGGVLPAALDLPALATPYTLTSLALVESTISDRRNSAWDGLRTRTDVEGMAFDGTPIGETLPLTITDRAVLEAIRDRNGISTKGTDTLYRQLHDTYAGLSKTVARDVLSVLDQTKGFEFLKADPLYGGGPFQTACIGSADICGNVLAGGSFDFALRLLKSNLVTSVTLRATSIANTGFDVHYSGGARAQTSHLRIALEAIGQVLNEMQLTPASSGQGSLLDETLVYIYSDFGRTFARSPQDGTDHHPATCGILVGGSVKGNQMLGGYDETAQGSPLGAPVNLIEESGTKATRPPTSQDIAATVIRAFGLQPGKDFFIPGGYGEFEGALLV